MDTTEWVWYFACVHGIGECWLQMPADIKDGAGSFAKHVTTMVPVPNQPNNLMLQKFGPLLNGFCVDNLGIQPGSILWFAQPTEKIVANLDKLWGKVQVASAGTLRILDRNKGRG